MDAAESQRADWRALEIRIEIEQECHAMLWALDREAFPYESR